MSSMGLLALCRAPKLGPDDRIFWRLTVRLRHQRRYMGRPKGHNPLAGTDLIDRRRVGQPVEPC